MQKERVAVEAVFQPKCEQCGHSLAGDYLNRHRCPGCKTPNPLLPDENFFSALGVAFGFFQKKEELELHFYEASRVLHPDRFVKEGSLIRDLSLKRMSFLNQSYQTLKNPFLLRRYILKQKGLLSEDSQTSPAKTLVTEGPLGELVEEWFEIRSQNFSEQEKMHFLEKLKKFQFEIEAKIQTLEKAYDTLQGSGSQKQEILLKIATEIQIQSYLKSLHTQFQDTAGLV
jgi:DnaJ-domain-containing protein 1